MMEKGDDNHLDDLEQPIQSRPSKILKIDTEDHHNHDKNPFQGQSQLEQMELKMEAEADHGHDLTVTNPNNDRFQTKLLKIKEFDDKNPFQISVILDNLFKLLSFEEVKKFRLVSSTWNEVGLKELSTRRQKPIKFNQIEELGSDDKLGELIQLKRRHNEVFQGDHQLFSNFSFNIRLLMVPQIDQFLEHFKPKFVTFFGYTNWNRFDRAAEIEEEEIVEEAEREEEIQEIDLQLPQILSKFLIKISATVLEIQYNNLYIYFNNKKWDLKFKSLKPYQELTTTKFPYLRKIYTDLGHDKDLMKMLFYPIIGQNSPKLKHLRIGLDYLCDFGSPEEMKEILEPTGLMSKLKILELFGVDSKFLLGLNEFAQNGVLKLTKLKYVNNNYFSNRVKNIFVSLISTQGESLKILKMSTPFSIKEFDSSRIRVPFPTLQNLTFLQINNFASFEKYFGPINFSLQFPKLKEFRTFEIIRRLLSSNLGECGESVKSVTLFKKYPDEEENLGYPKQVDFVKFGHIFPNLDFLELEIDALPIPGLENLLFWSQLKVVIHSQLKSLLNFKSHLSILKVIKKLEIVVHCENNMMDEDSYKNYLGSLMMGENDDNSDSYSRQKFYKKFMANISQDFNSILMTSFTIFGYKISEDFKSDFRAIFPETEFICSSFKLKPVYVNGDSDSE